MSIKTVVLKLISEFVVELNTYHDCRMEVRNKDLINSGRKDACMHNVIDNPIGLPNLGYLDRSADCTLGRTQPSTISQI